MDPFTTLGFARTYDLDKALLERRYRELQQALHPDKHTAAPAAQRQMNLRKAVEVNEAYRVLRDDGKRAEALLRAYGGSVTEQREADPELLMEMLELREALGEAREAGDAARVHKLQERVLGEVSALQTALSETFAALQSAASAAPLQRAEALVGRLRYYRRFLDEVAAFEDEALA
jgi:molecular chaperone HscB